MKITEQIFDRYYYFIWILKDNRDEDLELHIAKEPINCLFKKQKKMRIDGAVEKPMACQMSLMLQWERCKECNSWGSPTQCHYYDSHVCLSECSSYDQMRTQVLKLFCINEVRRDSHNALAKPWIDLNKI